MQFRSASYRKFPVRISCLGLSTALLLGLFAGCNPEGHITVVSEYGKDIKFDGLGSNYAWIAEPAPRVGSPELHDLIRTTAEKNLAEKGFVLTSEGQADFLVAHRVYRREKTDASVNPHGEIYEEGSLILDVLDPAVPQSPNTPRTRIWRGIARARIMDSDPPDLREKRMETAMKALMREFPKKTGGTTAS